MSQSHCSQPFINLYSKLDPAGSLIIVVQSGLEDVYWLAESAGADAVVPATELRDGSGNLHSLSE